MSSGPCMTGVGGGMAVSGRPRGPRGGLLKKVQPNPVSVDSNGAASGHSHAQVNCKANFLAEALACFGNLWYLIF